MTWKQFKDLNQDFRVQVLQNDQGQPGTLDKQPPFVLFYHHFHYIKQLVIGSVFIKSVVNVECPLSEKAPWFMQ